MRQAVEDFMRGRSSCVIAYGQSGSGKTFTMGHGYASQWAKERGLISRAASQTLAHAAYMKGAGGSAISVKLSAIEIYASASTGETLRDLVEPSSALQVREHSGRTFEVEGAAQVPVETEAEVSSVLRKASNARATGATQLNTDSSRSHLLVTFFIDDAASTEKPTKVREEPHACATELMPLRKKNDFHCCAANSSCASILPEARSKAALAQLVHASARLAASTDHSLPSPA